MNEEESKQTIECKAAIRAALEKVGEYCGLPSPEEDRVRTVEVRGVRIEVPDEIYEIAMRVGDDPSMGDRKQGEIERSQWARNKASDLCDDWWKLLTQKGYAEPMEPNVQDECVMRVAAEIATRVLEERQWYR